MQLKGKVLALTIKFFYYKYNMRNIFKMLSGVVLVEKGILKP